MYTESVKVGSLPPTLNEALITIILKKDKDTTDCKIYRPISLIGQDRKILAKILANRLDKIITHFINPDQVGFILSRNFSDNIRRFIDVMWASQNVNSPITAISLDTEKAFDGVDWPFLIATLKVFGLEKDSCPGLGCYIQTPGQQF